MSNDQTNHFRSALEAIISEFGIPALSEAQLGSLATHFAMLCYWNRRLNLTRITDPKDSARLHYAESIFGGKFIGDARSVVDVGSGAGFPAIPIAVLRPDIQVTALEANQKKALFLNEAKDAMGLSNLSIARMRFEDFDSQDFDLITSRALDRAEQVWSTALQTIPQGQRLVLYAATHLASSLAARLGERYRFELHPIPQTEARLIAIISHPE